MAISQVQSLLILLLGSLFFSLALCKTEINECYPKADYDLTISVDEVDISPNPVQRSSNANITLVADTIDPVPKGVTVKLQLHGRDSVSTQTYSLCDVAACPVASGTFRLFFTNIFNAQELQENDPHYRVTISITNKDPEDLLMCAIFYCKLSGNRSLPYIRRITR